MEEEGRLDEVLRMRAIRSRPAGRVGEFVHSLNVSSARRIIDQSLSGSDLSAKLPAEERELIAERAARAAWGWEASGGDPCGVGTVWVRIAGQPADVGTGWRVRVARR
ncbi:hypothetical protein [Streptomyces sp. AP-93]|uniref:hypothetical protein n=1 Tax=Streptomyces sp. AP-93 TaxID=2929048 RepID=UPI001FAF4F4C|nr:hypothetical protein [Streptomyces sp. AP-93]MCJ0874237.1 hypothetical protein [Streptomyces sp. AP-93]